MSVPVTRLSDFCSGHSSFPSRPSSEGSGDVFVNGIGVHREGDAWSPHASPSPSPPHSSVLAAGSSTVYVNGKQCGRIGDPVACGSVVVEGSPNVFAG